MLTITRTLSTLFVLVSFSVFVVGEVHAQECSDTEQSTQDTCIADALTTCLDVAPACQNRVATAEGVRTILIETCCCNGDSIANTAEFNACRQKKRKQFKRAAKIFPFDFRTSIKAVFSDISRDDCTACEF